MKNHFVHFFQSSSKSNPTYLLLLSFLILVAFVGCSVESSNEPLFLKSSNEPALEEFDSTKTQDTLVVAVLNQTIGFQVQNLLFTNQDDSMNVFRNMEALWEQYERNRPNERLKIQADSFAFYDPDVIALQEVMVFLKDGEINSDYITDLPQLIQAAGGSEYVTHFQKMNELELKLQARVGDSLNDGTELEKDSLLDLKFYEGNAILVKKSLTIVADGVDMFKSILGVPFLEDKIFYSERGNVWAKVQKGKKVFEVGSNHLEVSILATQSKNQAAELLIAMDGRRDPEIAQIIVGDLNYTPGTGTHEILSSTNTFMDLRELGSSDGVSCCQALDGAELTMENVLDYALVRNVVGGEVSYHPLGPIVIEGAPPLWAADHALLIAKIYAQSK